MDTWKQYTLRANTEYQLACYGNAILMHNQALDHARHHFGDEADNCLEQAIARVMISHFNLADCYMALEEYSRAADCYLAAQGFLVDVAQGSVTVDSDQQALLHANGHLHTLWHKLVKDHGPALAWRHQLAYHERSRELLSAAEAGVVRH